MKLAEMIERSNTGGATICSRSSQIWMISKSGSDLMVRVTGLLTRWWSRGSAKRTTVARWVQAVVRVGDAARGRRMVVCRAG
ncbi:hypothetical protein U1Q18_030904 [Sarracenia purpurea var. burkii]